MKAKRIALILASFAVLLALAACTDKKPENAQTETASHMTGAETTEKKTQNTTEQTTQNTTEQTSSTEASEETSVNNTEQTEYTEALEETEASEFVPLEIEEDMTIEIPDDGSHGAVGG